MALAVVGNGSDSELASPTFTFDYGFSPVDGNLLVATISRNLGVDDIDTPVGWTKVFSSLHSSATTAVFWKIATSSEPIFQDFTSSTSGGKWAGGIVEISGFDAAAPVDVSGTGTGLDLAPVSPAVTTTEANTLLIAGFGVNNFATATASAGLTSRWSQTTTSGGSVATAGGTIAQVATGLTSAYTHSISGDADKSWFAYTIAIAPATSSIDFIPSGNELFEPGLQLNQQLDIDHISTTIVMYEPTGSNVLPQQLDSDFISSGNALYEPFGFNYDLIKSTAVLHEPTVTLTLTLTADFISTSSVMYEPELYSGTVSAGFISGNSVLYEPAVTVSLAQQLDADFIASSEALYEPSFNLPKTIDGQPTLVIATNYQSKSLYYNNGFFTIN